MPLKDTTKNNKTLKEYLSFKHKRLGWNLWVYRLEINQHKNNTNHKFIY